MTRSFDAIILLALPMRFLSYLNILAWFLPTQISCISRTKIAFLLSAAFIIRFQFKNIISDFEPFFHAANIILLPLWYNCCNDDYEYKRIG